MIWEGTQEGEKHNKAIWKILRELNKKDCELDKAHIVRLLLETKNWLIDLDQRMAQMGVNGKLPAMFVELAMQDYAHAAQVRMHKEGTDPSEAFQRIKRICEAWGIDYERVVS